MMDYKQMSLLEDSPANLSARQDFKKEEQTIDSSGMKCLMLLNKSNRDGLLGKMCKALLISNKAWYSDKCEMTWKVKVSKSNVSLFQLVASVLGTKEKESGLLPTPKARDHQGAEGKRVVKTKTGWSKVRQGSKVKYGASLNDVVEHQMMYPSPTASDIEGGIAKDVKMKNGRFYRENKKGERWGVKLRDAVMYPTPCLNDSKNTTFPKSQKNRTSVVGKLMKMKQNNKPGGKLNPEFVEFLMGYPMGWTEIEPKE
jgi:hypothetical protein